MEETTQGRGRPSLYSDQTCDLICELVASGNALYRICMQDDMPGATTVKRWLMDPSKKDFWAKYAQAQLVRNQLIADELIDLSNPPETDNMVIINRNRLQIDTRKWWLSKVMPREYGDKVEQPEPPAAPTTDLSKLSIEEQAQWLALKRKMNPHP